MLAVQFVLRDMKIFTFVGQMDAHRTPVMRRTFLIDKSVLNQFFEIVGHVGTEVIAARRQLADRHFVVTDVIKNQGLDVVAILDTQPVEFGLDNINEPPGSFGFPAVSVEAVVVRADQSMRYFFSAASSHSMPLPARSGTTACPASSTIGWLRILLDVSRYSSRRDCGAAAMTWALTSENR